MAHSVRYKTHSGGLGFRVGESTTSQELVLELLMDGSGNEFTETQVRAQLGLPKSSINRALKELADEGLASAARVGRTLVYRVDPRDPLIVHLKIARAITRVREAIRPVAGLIDLAVLYGSASKGQDTTGSDVDVLIVSSSVDAVLPALAGLGWLQPVVLTPSQHMQLIAEGGTFADAVGAGIRIGGNR